MDRLIYTARIIGRFWSTSLLAETEYRGNFVVAALSSAGNLLGAAFSMWIFYRQDAGFPGWSAPDVAVLLGLFSVWTGVVAAILAPNLARLVEHVQNGTLEFVLLRPMDAQLQVSLRVLSPWGVPDVFFGVVLIAVGLWWGNGVSASALALAVVPIGAGVVLLYSLFFMLATTSIWFTKVHNATEVLRGLMEAGRFPMAAYPPAFRFFFTWIVPVAFLTTVPAETLLGRSAPQMVGLSVVVAGVALGLSRALWRRALKSYSGASS
jgi:ABC-2 type transport system permease protein